MTNGYRGVEVFGRRARRRVAAEKRRATRLLGAIAVLVAILTVVLFWMGVSFAAGDQNLAATNVAYLAIGASLLAIVLGFSAIILKRGRALGVVAVIVGLLANPVLVTRLLNWAAGLS